jgi:Flp pilus assembly protein TadD
LQRRNGSAPEVATPYRNARPGVRYVGDAACVRCHADIAETYRRHPMGRSLLKIDEAPAEMRGEEKRRDLFKAQGFTYSAARRGGRTLHRESRRDEQGRTIAAVDGEVRYVLGSGRLALAFLIERDGYLFESPMTWYSERKRWDLAPGYETNNPHFERSVTAGCLFCHANRVDHVAGTANRYREPIFQGHAIGCERCHGPGELHVREASVAIKGEPNIVNPSKLEPALRESVCQQCHLMGESAITERAERSIFDYRPGLPLYRYETVFVPPPGAARLHHNAGQVEQMYESRCFRQSRGAMGCISCHDPHVLPAPADRVAYYRDRCLECHAKRGCSVPADVRRVQSAEDSCIQCHMPRAAAADVPHIATTIHSIPRQLEASDHASSPPEASQAEPEVPVFFHADLMSPAEREEAKRDLGLALHMRGVWGARNAIPLFSQALTAHPGDVAAREGLGYALGAVGRGQEGLVEYEKVLERAPNRESALVGAATLSDKVGARKRSIEYWQRAIAVDPWQSAYYAALGRELAQSGQWPEAADACRSALRLNPANIEARVELVQCVLRMGSPQQARTEFETLLKFNPPEREALMRWFNSLR